MTKTAAKHLYDKTGIVRKFEVVLYCNSIKSFLCRNSNVRCKCSKNNLYECPMQSRTKNKVSDFKVPCSVLTTKLYIESMHD